MVLTVLTDDASVLSFSLSFSLSFLVALPFHRFVRTYLLERRDIDLLGGRHLPRVRPAAPEEGPPDAAQDSRPRLRAPVEALIVVGGRGRRIWKKQEGVKRDVTGM